ncbi:MAG: bifunctional phosphoribosylaminoimidazolecarboxamide formyltransferase/IMP cyclohydrolase PurH [Proteobacteria bacterium]|nr:bifunctional phosphoribosylaminoimidazolecarboxamide formyltransferase/IMP cyclohydrolase PurH [Pseudomonadota bacterium]
MKNSPEQNDGASRLVRIKRALVSVSDKTNLIGLVRVLAESGVEILSTGGTARAIREVGIPVQLVEDWTGFPECFGGRLKTLSPKIYGGILYRRDDPSHVADADRLKLGQIDLVVCNLYPFQKHVDMKSPDDELIENIDIGGPSMIRAAAKNHDSVTICTDPSQYEKLISNLEAGKGQTSIEFRREMAVDAYRLTAQYDAAIAAELDVRFSKTRATFPWSIELPRQSGLRYGENPHQRAAVAVTPGTGGVASASVLQGKELSWNNLLDADAAWRLASDLAMFSKDPAVAIIKHGNPCGVAVAKSLDEALARAWDQDSTSAFGGIIACTHKVTEGMATFLQDRFCEVILAPGYLPAALKIFSRKKSLRLMQLDLLGAEKEVSIRSISGGFLMQEEDVGIDPELVNTTKIKLNDGQVEAARFGAIVAKHLKSNSIALVAQTPTGYELVGAGMGQPNRIDSLRKLALPRAIENMKRSPIQVQDLVLASDAFFPFPDTVEVASDAGVKAIIQPGGSIRDPEIIESCNRLGVAMAFTGRRHFRH